MEPFTSFAKDCAWLNSFKIISFELTAMAFSIHKDLFSTGAQCSELTCKAYFRFEKSNKPKLTLQSYALKRCDSLYPLWQKLFQNISSSFLYFINTVTTAATEAHAWSKNMNLFLDRVGFSNYFSYSFGVVNLYPSFRPNCGLAIGRNKLLPVNLDCSTIEFSDTKFKRF